MSDPRTPSALHELKTWPLYFELVVLGVKRFELRKDDRGFKAGDVLVLREWHPTEGGYTGRRLRTKITYVLRDTEHLAPGYVALSLGDVWDIYEGSTLTAAETPKEDRDHECG